MGGGVSVLEKGASVKRISVHGVSVLGGLCPVGSLSDCFCLGSLSRESLAWGLYQSGLCPGGSLAGGLCDIYPLV